MKSKLARRVIAGLLLLLISAFIVWISVPQYGNHIRGRGKATQATLYNVASALQAFLQTLFGRIPTEAEGLEVLVRPAVTTPGWDHQFMEKVPTDAWGRALRYRVTQQHGNPEGEVISAGEDGVFDTADDLSSQR